jgi:tetratricopeptide (TPR) repeat protein
MYGYILLKAERWDDSSDSFRRAIGINPDHYVGYFNLAYINAKQGRWPDCMKNLRKMAANQKRVTSYRRVSDDLFKMFEEEFAPLRESSEYGEEFKKIVAKLNG